jgi:hypothetical protein
LKVNCILLSDYPGCIWRHLHFCFQVGTIMDFGDQPQNLLFHSLERQLLAAHARLEGNCRFDDLLRGENCVFAGAPFAA